METIKISVEVSVNLSENTQNFIASLFNSVIAAAPVVKTDAARPFAKKDAGVSEQERVNFPQSAPADAPVAEDVDSTHACAPDATSPTKTIEDVRKMLAQKVSEHRDAIKQKLNYFGAQSVTKLDPSKYDEMYEFLTSL